MYSLNIHRSSLAAASAAQCRLTLPSKSNTILPPRIQRPGPEGPSSLLLPLQRIEIILPRLFRMPIIRLQLLRHLPIDPQLWWRTRGGIRSIARRRPAQRPRRDTRVTASLHMCSQVPCNLRMVHGRSVDIHHVCIAGLTAKFL
jgi:hypothetical protein